MNTDFINQLNIHSSIITYDSITTVFMDTSPNQVAQEAPECLFCCTGGKLYQSTACECNYVYFHKACITQNMLSGEVHAKNCPQCRTPLNLTIGGPERVCCCETVMPNCIETTTSNAISCITLCGTLCDSAHDSIYEFFTPKTHVYIGLIINLVIIFTLICTDSSGTRGDDGHNMEIYSFCTVLGINILYQIGLGINTDINYSDNSYFCFTAGKSSYGTSSKYYSFLSS